MDKVKSSFKIFHINIQSIRSKLSEIDIYIDSLSENVPDVLCFSETFLKNGDQSCIQIEGFKLAEYFCRKNQRRGGVCIFVKNFVHFNKLEWLHDFAVVENFECCGIYIPEIKIIVICLYRSGKNFNIFFEKLEILLFKLTRKHRNLNNKVVLVGDFNINLFQNDHLTSRFLEILNIYKFKCRVTNATRITSHSQTCIDNIITNFNKCKAEVLNLGLSDHTAQTLEFPCSTGFSVRHWYVYKRKVDNYIDIFMKYISQIKFQEVFEQTHPNEAYNVFVELYKTIYDLCFPIEKCKVTYRKKPNWKTKGIKTSSKRKRQLFIEFQKTRSEFTTTYYNKYKKILRSTIRYSKRRMNINYITKSTNKTKATWNTIKQNTSTTNEIPTIINKLQTNEGNITDPIQIAEHLNRYYVTENLNSKFIDNYKPITDPQCKSIYLNPVDEQEIQSIVKSIKSKRSCGEDGISMDVIKTSIDTIISPLVHIINLMLQTGYFPDKMKLSLIKPLHKKGSKKESENYRPIALLPNFSKIFEKVIYKRIANFLEKHNVLSQYQFGFRKMRSTSLSIFTFLHRLCEDVNLKKDTTALFLDMSKAFDCVVHSVLLKQLDNYGIRGIANDLIYSYLTDRKQALCVTMFDNKCLQEAKSTYLTNILGVPQGSVLGPLLFIIYINELPCLTKHLPIMFADDVTILFTNNGKTEREYELDINNTLNGLTTWLKSLNLKVNYSKTKLIQFGNYKKVDLDLNISCENNAIDEVNNIKFLGITIDKNLSWKHHINVLNIRLCSYCYALSVLVDVASVEVAVNAYYGNVYPLLMYGVIFWGNSVDAVKTFTIQKRCLRIIYSKPSDFSLRTLYKEKGFLTLAGIYILEICLFVRNNSHFFTKVSNVHTVNVRNKDRLVLPVIRSMIFDHSTYVTAIRIYNRLPINIKQLKGNQFKIFLKKWLIDNVFYNLNEFYKLTSNI